MQDALETEIDRNLFAFQSVLSDLMASGRDQFALLRHQAVNSVHAKLSDALRTGHELFADGVFSVQKITDEPVDLGYFSHAGYPGE